MNTPINEAVERPALPEFIVRNIERAIEDAMHPKGMHTNGKCMAQVEVSQLQRLLLVARAALPPPIVEPVKLPVMWMVYISGLPEAFRTYAEAERERRDYEAGTGEPHEDPAPLYTPSSAPTIRKSQTVAPASTLGQQVARAQAEVATWSPEKRASVRLEGSGQYTTASAPSDGAADARDAATWRKLLEQVIREIPKRSPSRNGDAPGHSHSIPGIWDSDNGAKAGTECAWCAVWKEANRAIASTHTTTGGEKP